MENVPQPPILLFRNNQVLEACTSIGVTEMGTWRNIIISVAFGYSRRKFCQKLHRYRG